MKRHQRVAVLGGDERQIYMAEALAQSGYEVLVWGLGMRDDRLDAVKVCDTWSEAIEGAEAVVLPLPATTDGVRVHCPLHHKEESLRVTTLLDQMKGGFLLGGRLDGTFCAMAEQKGIPCIDYFASETLQMRNALPTAEGAIAIAMRELPVTLDGTTVAVIGYGRIGSLLARKLTSLGAHVYVYARRREALTDAELYHQIPVMIEGEGAESSLVRLPRNCRALFNTVPARLYDREMLSLLPKSCVLIDLASVPGGYDQRQAQELGLRTVWGASLPGKCTPESAGKILAQTVKEQLQDHFPE